MVMDVIVGDELGITIIGRAYDCSVEPTVTPVPVLVVGSESAQTAGGESAPEEEKPAEERLRELKELKTKGLSSEDEYQQRRKAILDWLTSLSCPPFRRQAGRLPGWRWR